MASLLLLATGHALAAAAGPVGYPVVNTTLGQLRGVTQEYEGRLLHAYRGIRYTEPPVNERRFLRTRLIDAPWSGVQNATGYGATCIQNPANVSGSCMSSCQLAC
jgi:carboxylesterase type B